MKVPSLLSSGSFSMRWAFLLASAEYSTPSAP